MDRRTPLVVLVILQIPQTREGDMGMSEDSERMYRWLVIGHVVYSFFAVIGRRIRIIIRTPRRRREIRRKKGAAADSSEPAA